MWSSGSNNMLRICLLLSATNFLVALAMSSLGPSWGERYNSSNSRSPYPNSYALCALKARTLAPVCSGTWPSLGDTEPPTGTSLFALSSGAYFSCGLVYGTMKPVCWGDSNVSVPSSFQNVSYLTLSSGSFHVCGLRSSNGAIDCWGNDLYGETQPPKNISFTYISSGFDFTCGLTERGEAYCWGWNGVTTDFDVPQPANIVFSSIYSGGQHVCGIEQNTAKAFCWGRNRYNQSNPPTDVDFKFIAMGMYHSCGLVKVTGKVVCWGDDFFKQRSEAPEKETFSLIAAGDYYTCGVSMQEVQRVKCWGNSVIFTQTGLKASQGLCSSRECSGEEQEFPDSAVGGVQQCLVRGDRICLDCFQHCVRNATTVPSGAPPEPLKSRKSNHVSIIVGVIGGALVCIVILLACLLYYRNRTPISPRRPRPRHVEAWTSLANRLTSFTKADLAAATNNYSPEMIVGKGAFGVVYKGVLSTGQALAIKTSKVEDDLSLVKELELLSRVHHVNLVNLVGYCATEKLLAFEFMENGSLSDILFKRPGMKLNWRRRIQIAAQAARGLEYLHVYASPQILHRDVKSANILLDQHWNAHISDFGLSLLEPPANATHVSFVTVAGTPGYIDPEYVQTMHFGSKSDVYSFGVVLLELLTGRHAVQKEVTLVAWVSSAVSDKVERFGEKLRRLAGDDMLKVLDSGLEADSNMEASEALQSVLELALQCTSHSGKSRPSMTRVANTLEQVLKEKDHQSYASGSSTEASSGENNLVQGFDQSVVLPR